MSFMMKMDFKDDFRHKNGWGIIYMNQFGLKTNENDGFWNEKEWRKKPFLEREWDLVCRNEEEDEWF